MGERLHPEEIPKTLSEYESWLTATLEGLQKDLDFYDNVPGHMEQYAFSEAADLVAQAGIFGLSFVPANILEDLRGPRKTMRPLDAALCIRKLLDWCHEQRSLDKASSPHQTVGESLKAPKSARHCESDSVSMESPRTSPAEIGGNKKEELPKRVRRAYESFKLAEARRNANSRKTMHTSG